MEQKKKEAEEDSDKSRAIELNGIGVLWSDRTPVQ